uniref:Uncharacterized protein n=1 Tax=Arundo donax TaxID=35708 RepID=A0A0A8ZG89_ARUDO
MGRDPTGQDKYEQSYEHPPLPS